MFVYHIHLLDANRLAAYLLLHELNIITRPMHSLVQNLHQIPKVILNPH